MPMNDAEGRQFAAYFAAAHGRVRRVAYVICGDWHWAEDLTQTAFIRLAAGWHRVEDHAALDAYVRTCLIRAYLAETRRVWRRREQSWAELPETGADDASEAVTRRLVFERALRRLPPRQRVTLVCRYYQGLDVAQTAAALRCSEGTVKSQTAKGLASLRAVLGTVDLSDPDVPAGGVYSWAI
ncbi:SigE family RNA polymerase sigma factor [Mangrovihabitans endophyticus]|uniref:RNA polymerase sigma24 factor n=1 Tax=Mangrovihabitans endophyticus TaxID=1751298 RepID=A0A8J3C5G2_9ACTN|nr:SigE family RNA polymerase sigma factor [Mangrovihabitans endophyticus]GGL13226.1 RNA polymerase sigma24 factor [Mangrovihabitans endophyticus]